MNAEHYDNEKLAKKRAEKFTQAEFAAELGKSEMTVNRAEKGKQISYELLLEMCRVLELDIREILIADPSNAAGAG